MRISNNLSCTLPIISYSQSGGYGGTAPGLYGPVKIDLGGVLIGSILGFGAVIILPKIIHALSYSYGGGYGRSEYYPNLRIATE